VVHQCTESDVGRYARDGLLLKSKVPFAVPEVSMTPRAFLSRFVHRVSRVEFSY
jgi:hypothetical protein